MENRPIIAPEMSLEDARLALSEFLPFSPRGQRKTYYRLFCRFKEEIPYARFKSIVRGDSKPSSQIEGDLVSGMSAYLEELAAASSSGSMNSFPGTVIEACSFALAQASGASGMDLFLRANVALASLGLGPIGVPQSHLPDLSSPGHLFLAVSQERDHSLLCLRKSKKPMELETGLWMPPV